VHEESVEWVKSRLAGWPSAPRVVRLVQEQQARMSGEGHPESQDVLSSMLHVVDAYDTRVHVRLHREPQLPHQAMRELLKFSASEFHEPAVRALVEVLSLYPPGSYVRLSNGTPARVVRVHPDYPTRPVVRTVPDAQEWDLTAMPMLHIEEALDPLTDSALDETARKQARLAQFWV